MKLSTALRDNREVELATTEDLEAASTFVGAEITGSATEVAICDGAGNAAGAAGLTWDESNTGLSIGTPGLVNGLLVNTGGATIQWQDGDSFGAINAAQFQHQNYSGSVSVNPINHFVLSSGGTAASPIAVANNDRIWDFFADGNDGTQFVEMADLSVFVDGAVSAGVVPGRFVFTCADEAGVLQPALTVRAKNIYTPAMAVGALPSAATAGAGARAFVSDSSVATFGSTVADGGSGKVPVYSDGTNWKVG